MLGIRWTIGDVSLRGFESLRLATWGAWRLSGAGPSHCVALDSLTLDRDRELRGDRAGCRSRGHIPGTQRPVTSTRQLLERGRLAALVVAAHPDDETIGQTCLMARRGCSHIIHVTDGAPRQPRFWPPAAAGLRPRSRLDYARIRRTELERALALAGIAPARAHKLGAVDQEAARIMPGIAQQLTDAITAIRPDIIITHAYEGGHPDHDAVALATWAATRLLARRGSTPPPIYEMALYHGASGSLEVGRFLPRPSGGGAGAVVPEPEIELVIELTDEELELRRAMLECFASQRHVLAPFHDQTCERFRPAPAYDFTQPPHHGPLLYEINRFPISGEAWRELAAQALLRLGLVMP